MQWEKVSGKIFYWVVAIVMVATLIYNYFK